MNIGKVTHIDNCKKSTGKVVRMMGKIALALVIVGALNWLLVGVFEWDLVSALFGGDSIRESSWISRIVYIAVGLCGLYCIKYLFTDRVAERT